MRFLPSVRIKKVTARRARSQHLKPRPSSRRRRPSILRRIPRQESPHPFRPRGFALRPLLRRLREPRRLGAFLLERAPRLRQRARASASCAFVLSSSRASATGSGEDALAGTSGASPASPLARRAGPWSSSDARASSALRRDGLARTGLSIFVLVIARRPAVGRFNTWTSEEYLAPSYPPNARSAAPPPTATSPRPSAASDEPAATSAAEVHSRTSPSPSPPSRLRSATVSLRPPSGPPPRDVPRVADDGARGARAGTGTGPAGSSAFHVIAMVSRTNSSPLTSPADPPRRRRTRRRPSPPAPRRRGPRRRRAPPAPRGPRPGSDPRG